MAIPTRAGGYVVQPEDWNQLVDALNRAAPALLQTVSALDGNGSIVLTTGEETDVILNGIGAVDVNGCTVPARSPWPLYLVNVSASTCTFKHEDLSEPTPAKRFLLPGGTDYPLALGQGISLRYVSAPVGARWVVFEK